MVRLQSRFSFSDPMLLLARVRLEDGRLVMTGWNWLTRYMRRIEVKEIVHVDAKSNNQLVVWLMDGEVVRLRIQNPALWKDAIEASKAQSRQHE